MMLCSEVAMTDAEKESEARCTAMLSQLIAAVKKQTLEMEDLAVSMEELAVGLKAIVQPPGASAHALPPPVPAPTATLVTVVDHAMAAAAPRAEAALAPESPTKCSTSDPDTNAGDLQVVAESDPETGVPTIAPALAEHSSAPSPKLFSTIKRDTLTPTKCSMEGSGLVTVTDGRVLARSSIDKPPSVPSWRSVIVTKFDRISDRNLVVPWSPHTKWVERQPWPPPVLVENVGVGAQLWLTPWPSLICYRAGEQLKQPWPPPIQFLSGVSAEVVFMMVKGYATKFPGLKAVLVKYKDKEGDLVTITNQDELKWVEELAKSGSSLRFYVTESNLEHEPYLDDTNSGPLERNMNSTSDNGSTRSNRQDEERSTVTCIDDWIVQFARLFKNHVRVSSDEYLDLHEVSMKLYTEAIEDTITTEEAQGVFQVYEAENAKSFEYANYVTVQFWLVGDDFSLLPVQTCRAYGLSLLSLLCRAKATLAEQPPAPGLGDAVKLLVRYLNRSSVRTLMDVHNVFEGMPSRKESCDCPVGHWNPLIQRLLYGFLLRTFLFCPTSVDIKNTAQVFSAWMVYMEPWKVQQEDLDVYDLPPPGGRNVHRVSEGNRQVCEAVYAPAWQIFVLSNYLFYSSLVVHFLGFAHKFIHSDVVSVLQMVSKVLEVLGSSKLLGLIYNVDAAYHSRSFDSSSCYLDHVLKNSNLRLFSIDEEGDHLNQTMNPCIHPTLSADPKFDSSATAQPFPHNYAAFELMMQCHCNQDAYRSFVNMPSTFSGMLIPTLLSNPAIHAAARLAASYWPTGSNTPVDPNQENLTEGAQ